MIPKSIAGLLILAAILLVVPAQAVRAEDKTAATWALLEAADFHRLPHGVSRIWRVGDIETGGRHYEIWSFRWRQNKGLASYQHENGFILVIEQTKAGRVFLGGYPIERGSLSFAVRDRYLDFDYPKKQTNGERNRIVFGDNGPPPRVHFLRTDFTFDLADHHRGVWRLLSDGGFSGKTDIYARIQRSGRIAAGGRSFEIWAYSWEQPLEAWADYPPGHDRQEYRVLIFEQKPKGLSYLGSYKRDNVEFRIEGRTIAFNLPKSGKPQGFLVAHPAGTIAIDDKGPPAEARVNWTTRKFEK